MLFETYFICLTIVLFPDSPAPERQVMLDLMSGDVDLNSFVMYHIASGFLTFNSHLIDSIYIQPEFKTAGNRL